MDHALLNLIVVFNVACVASVPVRAKCCVSRARENSGRAKIGARGKKGKEL